MRLNGMSDATWLRLLFAHLSGGDAIDKYMPSGFLDEHLVKMVNAFHEHAICATLNCVRGGYPLVALLIGARYPWRMVEKLNTALPFVSFKDANIEREETPAHIPPPLERANTAHDRTNYLTPEPTQASALEKLNDAWRIAKLCDEKRQPEAGSQIHQTRAAAEVKITPYEMEEIPRDAPPPAFEPAKDWAVFVSAEGGSGDVEVYDDAGSVVSLRSSRQSGAGHSLNSRTATLSATLKDGQRREAAEALTTPQGEGWPFYVNDAAKIVLQRPYGPLVGDIELDQEHIAPAPMPAGTQGVFRLEPVRRSPSLYCQPMAAGAGLTWIMETHQLAFHHGDQLARFIPFAAVVDFLWNDLGHSLAECLTIQVAANSRRQRLVAESFQSDLTAELYNRIGVRLRQGGSRVPVVPNAQGGCNLKMPKGANLFAGHGSPDDEVTVRVNVNVPAGHDLVLFVNESDKQGDYKRIDYLVVPRDPSKELPASGRKHLQDVVEPWVHEFFIICVAGLRGAILVDDEAEGEASTSSAA